MKENFTEMHIRELQKVSRRDPILLERAVYAFGLLEAIVRVGLPFVFKGGTCLMLLLEHPRRLSTDIDIMVEPGVEVDDYIQMAADIFPFVRCEEQRRVGKNMIEKRHFKFTYDSPINGKELYILLDVLFEHNPYTRVNLCGIQNELLLVEPEVLKVQVPSVECVLGDKLAAFAPYTTGIPLNAGKDMEVIKQLYDICSLLDVFTNFEDVRDTYKKVAKSEIAYRGLDIHVRDVLTDMFQAAFCIASRGKVKKEDYKSYVKGIRDLRSHIYAEQYSPEIAAVRSVKVMYMVVCLLTNMNYEKVQDYERYTELNLSEKDMKYLTYLKKVNIEAYAYAVKTERLVALVSDHRLFCC